MYTPSYVWALVLGYIRRQLTDIVVSAWFEDTQVIDMTQDKLVICSPNEFRRNMIRQNCTAYIHDALQEIMGHPMELEIWDEQTLQEHRQTQPESTLCNPQFTFDSFIAGASNTMAKKVAMAVAAEPGTERFNPFFLYGPSGVGKTHLLYAMVNELRRSQPQLKVTYIRSEEFTTELIDAIRCGDKALFKQKYRQTDVLLVDDIHFIAGKEATQEEFFNTFNTLIELGRQIVLASDRRPCEISTLDDRLRSRFEGSIPIEITPPDYETRLAVIRAKAAAWQLPLQPEAEDYIARLLKDNIRQVEGGLKKLLAFHQLTGMRLSMDNIRSTLADFNRGDREQPVTEEAVLSKVCQYYGLDRETITGQSRSKGVAQPRQLAMYLIRRLVGTATHRIGALFGGRDHATVLYNLKKAEQALRDPEHPMHHAVAHITAALEKDSV